jgi:putative phosphoribosyl transferase
MDSTTEKIDMTIPVGRHTKLKGKLNLPQQTDGLVIFAHGSGSGRFSPKNNFFAEMLNKENIATLLPDLLTEEEDANYDNRYDIDLLTDRLMEVTEFVLQMEELKNLKTGYFGANTGTASALLAAARLEDKINAVVSQGGRPDLAENGLNGVKAPTLFIVGGLDEAVIDLNRTAYSSLQCEKKLKVIDGASHLFEERGKLEQVSLFAGNWFVKFLKPRPGLSLIKYPEYEIHGSI